MTKTQELPAEMVPHLNIEKMVTEVADPTNLTVRLSFNTWVGDRKVKITVEEG